VNDEIKDLEGSDNGLNLKCHLRISLEGLRKTTKNIHYVMLYYNILHCIICTIYLSMSVLQCYTSYWFSVVFCCMYFILLRYIITCSFRLLFTEEHSTGFQSCEFLYWF
jgi:hypothetical protein